MFVFRKCHTYLSAHNVCLSCRPGWRGPGPTVEQPVRLNPLYAIEQFQAAVERPGVVAVRQCAERGNQPGACHGGLPALQALVMWLCSYWKHRVRSAGPSDTPDHEFGLILRAKEVSMQR